MLFDLSGHGSDEDGNYTTTITPTPITPNSCNGKTLTEMLPMLISMFSEVNVNIKWIVISPSKKYESSFFSLTKQMHNNIHGSFDNKTMTELGDKERECLEAVCSDCFNEFVTLIKPNDIIVVHDPQPLAMIKFSNMAITYWC
eukprot:221433_1